MELDDRSIMQVFDNQVYEIVEHGLEGNGLTREETRVLFEVPERTKEAALIRWAGQELSLKAATFPAIVENR